jgi:hypothetical protein
MKVYYHMPDLATWPTELHSDERKRLERVIMLAIERAVKGKAQQGSEIVATATQGSGTTGESIEFSRYENQAGAYNIPTYNAGGDPRPLLPDSEG